MGKRVVFTGGSGKVGRYVVPYLLSRGHKVLNLDLVPLDLPGVNTMIVDLADSGETFNALSTPFDFGEVWSGKGAASVDAVVHFAAIRGSCCGRTTPCSQRMCCRHTMSSRRRPSWGFAK